MNEFETKPTAFPLGQWRYVTHRFIITVYFSYFSMLWCFPAFFLSFVKWKVKYSFVTKLCKLLVYNSDISPSHDKYTSPSGSIAYSCLDLIKGSHIGSSRGLSPLMATHIRDTFLLWSRYRKNSFCAPSIFTNNTTLINPSICRYRYPLLFHLPHGLSWKIRGINM